MTDPIKGMWHGKSSASFALIEVVSELSKSFLGFQSENLEEKPRPNPPTLDIIDENKEVSKYFTFY